MVETFIIVTEQVEQANKVFSVHRVTLTLREVSTVIKSTTSYVYSKLVIVFLSLRQLNSTWLLVVSLPHIDNVTYKRKSHNKQEKSKQNIYWLRALWGEGTRLIGGKFPPRHVWIKPCSHLNDFEISLF